jgi:hypothetical protein
LPARKVISAAWAVVVDHPRQAMLPLLVIQVPVAVVTSGLLAVLLLTVFGDEEIDTTHGGQLLAVLLIGAAQALFAQVARGGTIVSIAGMLTGKPRSLTESLDPAFNRMGGLLALVLLVSGGLFLAFISLVGLLLLPYLALRLALSFEAFMLEELGPLQALGRSWRLMRGHMLRLLAVVLLTVAILFGPFLVISLMGEAVRGDRNTEVILGAVYSLVQGVLLIPIVAFVTATTTVFYLNLREQERG